MQNLNTQSTREEINKIARKLYGKDMEDLQETQKQIVVRYYLEKTQREEVNKNV